MSKSNIDKLDWLLKLEQESWQAELIISGLAIFGSLQLPDLITRFGQWAFTYFSSDVVISLSVLTGYNLLQSKTVALFNPDILFRVYERNDRTNPENYEEHLTKASDRIFSTIISSELIEGSMMKVFIPIFHNEDPIIAQICGEFESDDQLERKENRKKSQIFYSECYEKYHRISVNDQIYEMELVKYTHPHHSTEGVLTYIPTVNFKKGKNLLKVEKLSGDTTGVYRTMIVPFWFGGE